MTCGACGVKAPETQSEIIMLVTKHPIASVVIGLSVLGWVASVCGALVAQCPGNVNK